MVPPDVLYVYHCDACGHGGEVHLPGDDHAEETMACSICGAPVSLEWDGGVTFYAEPDD